VSSSGPSGQGSFFERLLEDLVQMMGTTGTGSGPRLEMARTFARQVAAGTEPEANVDPSERIRLEELARLAEMHVGEVTGMPTTPSGSPVEILAVGPGAWAWHTVEDWQFLLDPAPGGPAGPDAGDRPGPDPGDRPDPDAREPAADLSDLGDLSGLRDLGGLADLGNQYPGFGEDTPEGPEALLHRVMSTMGPMLSAMQLGSAVGHMARTTMGAYDLPIPRLVPSRLLLVPASISRFASDWGLSTDEVRLWVCLRELTVHSVVVRPHIADRIRALLVSFTQEAPADLGGLAGMLGNVDPNDPETFRSFMEDPTALLGVELSPQRARIASELAAITSPLAGYVEHVLDQAGARLLGDRSRLAEAWKRHQVEGRSQMSATEAFLGFDTGAAELERGTNFVNGVLERAGEEGLSRLWESEDTLPTPTEADAPGLWLERLKLQDS
jgi:putative hydrolase